jgi:hypothetical protein
MRTHTRQHLIAAVFALILSTTAAVNAAPMLERTDGWPYAGARAVALDTARDLAFLSSGGAILVLDVSNPAMPQLLSDSLHTNGHVRDLRYVSKDRRLYIADWSGGLEIWNLDDPQSPERLSAVPVYYVGTDSDQPTDNLVMAGDYLYINANEARVHAFNISDPADPVDLDVQAGPLWYYPYDRDTDDVAVSDGYVYVSGDGIAKFQILGNGTLDKVGEYLNPESVTCIEVEGAFAYAGVPGGLGIFDVSGPYPSMMGSAPASPSLNDLALSGDRVFAVNRNDLYVFDVSNPQQPQQIGSLSLPDDGYRIRLDGDVAYVTTDGSGLQVIDISDLEHPALMGGYDTVGTTGRVTVAGSNAFIGQSTAGLVITDVSDPNAVQFVTETETGGANESVRIGDYLYVTDWSTSALRVFDVSDVSHPMEVGGVHDFYAVQIATDGDYLYVLRFNVDTQLYYLHVFGLDDPTSPAELSTMTVGPFIFELEYGKGHLFAIEFYEVGMHVIDVTDPYNPHEVELYPLDWGEDVWIDGDRAYVASFHDGLLVLDITDPANPVELGGIHEPFQYDSVAATGNMVLATTGLSTRVLHLYDVSDPANLVELDNLELPGEAWDLTLHGTTAYIAGGYTGLQIIRAGGGGVPGDVDGDNDVDTEDLLLLLAAWGDCPDPPEDCPADFDGDGDVDTEDLLTLLANWG